MISAYRYVLLDETGEEVNVKFCEKKERRPFGIRGKDFSRKYKIVETGLAVAANPLLVWSKEPPTKIGMYFRRLPSGTTLMAKVTKFGNAFVYEGVDVREFAGEWAGPIPEPVDP
jgi:hypothetical protein